MGKFHLNKTSAGWHFNLRAGNGEPILSSETYESKSAASNGIESVRTNSQRDDAFEVRESAGGKTRFVLKATNGQVIGTSEAYSSESGCRSGIESVKKNAPDAEVVED